MTDIFISYSRKDTEFIQTLHKALKVNNQDTWIDWQDIPLIADWWEQIEYGIEGANTFIFVITSDSIVSKVCRQEVNHAVKHNKKLVPIVRKEGFDMKQVHPEIARRNWLYFRETDDFHVQFQKLMEVLQTDLEYIRVHTRLTVKASEWKRRKYDSSVLLQGNLLTEAESWLSKSSHQNPKPSELQKEYIFASLSAETASVVYRNLVVYLKNFLILITDLRRSRRNLFLLPIEWLMYIITICNVFLFMWDITYLSLRDIYVTKAPILTIYDPIKGIEPHQDTDLYLKRFNDLNEAVNQRINQELFSNYNQGINQGNNENIDDILADLRERSIRLIVLMLFQKMILY